jgi:aryl-alcohol dehydrogenase-like predicted oxidoreductase
VVLTPGSRTPAHIDENLDAARIDIHPDMLQAVERLLAAAVPAGGLLR